MKKYLLFVCSFVSIYFLIGIMTVLSALLGGCSSTLQNLPNIKKEFTNQRSCFDSVVLDIPSSNWSRQQVLACLDKVKVVRIKKEDEAKYCLHVGVAGCYHYQMQTIYLIDDTAYYHEMVHRWKVCQYGIYSSKVRGHDNEFWEVLQKINEVCE